MTIVDKAIYRNGVRIEAPGSLGELNAACNGDACIAWLGLYRPTAEEFAEVASAFDLHALAVEDAITAHQRPKLERYGEAIFLVLRPARYVTDNETVELGEVHVFAAPNFVITVRHGEALNLHAVRERLEARPDLLSRGSGAIVHAIVDSVVDGYGTVVEAVQGEIDEIEDDVFDGSPTVSRRIYAMAREVIALQRATIPLPAILERLMAHSNDEEERHHLRDVLDHALRVEESVAGFRELLQNILNVNLTLETKALSEAANETNEQVKKISAWAAIFFAPTLVGTIYGMNFRHMPELGWGLGYPIALLLMVLVSGGLYLMFKNRGWL